MIVTPSRNRLQVIPADLDRTVRDAAKRRGMTVSAYIRLAAARQAEADALSA